MNPELELARELLEDARLLLTQGCYRSTVSRAYYAAYHACIALMESLGLKPQNYIGKSGRPAGRWEHGIVTAEVAADPGFSSKEQHMAILQYEQELLQQIKDLLAEQVRGVLDCAAFLRQKLQREEDRLQEERERTVERMDERRKRIGPVGIRAADLVEEGRGARVAEVLFHCQPLGR